MKTQVGKCWCVYLLECKDGTYYCGITINLQRRVQQHNEGKASKYTRSRLPVKVKAFKGWFTKSEALKLELKIKSFRREQKISMFQKTGWERDGTENKIP